MKEVIGTTTSSAPGNQPTGDQRTGNVEGYVREAIAQFLKDPPDTDFQDGYLCALVNVAMEAIGLPFEGDIEAAWQLTLQSELDRKGDRK